MNYEIFSQAKFELLETDQTVFKETELHVRT